jgi:hypothetical protein
MGAADFYKTSQIRSNSMKNMNTVIYESPIKKYAQTTSSSSADGVS